MTRQAKNLAALLIPAILLIGANAWAAPAGQDQATAIQQFSGQRSAEIIIHNGCPAGLDKICRGRRHGRLYHCRCAS